MGDILSGLGIGFGVAFDPMNLAYCFAGVLVGTLIGVLPGIGPVPTIAILLPFSFNLPPEAALIMLAGIYYGAQYGGSTTAILVNMPGESASVVTCIDGYQMARQGRAGVALATSALGSFFAGTVATFVIALLGPPLTRFAQEFGAPEYVALMVLGLIGAVVLSSGSVVKSLGMIVLGLLLGLVGLDVTTGAERFTFGIPELNDGLGFVPVAMGLFGLAEIIANLEATAAREVMMQPIRSLMPTREDVRRATPAVMRGTLVGAILGVLPGGGAILSSFAAYAVEKKVSRRPEEFGQGAIEGVAGPESANNAAAQTSFIPLLTLGIPGNAVMAVMMGAMMIQGIAPGPQVMTSRPELFWGVIVSMWIGNLMLVVLNLPLIGIWVRLLKVPYHYLFPAILVFSVIGVYSVGDSVFDVFVAVVFAFVGYFFRKVGCEPAPLVLGFILGPLLEENLRRALLLSRGDPMTFIDNPLSAGLFIAAIVLLIAMIAPALRRRRAEAFVGD